jgi:putative ABC transport system permease protein
MNVLLRVWAIVVVAAKRLLSMRWLSLATMAGLVVSVALTVSVPLYADAVYYRVLQEELTGNPEGEEGTRMHPPFAFMFRYIGAWTEPVEWEDAQLVDSYLGGPVVASLGLPQERQVRYFKTNNFQLFPQADIEYADVKDPLAWVSIGFISDLQDNIFVLEGTFPPVAEPVQGSVVDVMISEPLATELGLQVGEQYITFARRREEDGTQRNVQMPVRIAGVWRPVDPSSEFWFYTPSAFEDVLIVPEGTFVNRLSPYLEDEVYQALWYLVMDGSEVHATDAVPLLTRITIIQQKVSSLLTDTRLDVSPVSALQKYWRSSRLLTIMLYAFSVPIVGLILSFIGLVVGLAVARRRNEIAVLRSRGATATQVIGIAILEGLLLGVAGLVAGLFAGTAIAQLIGRAASFLDFSLASNLRVAITTQTIYFGLAAIGLALLAQVLPTVGASRHTIVTYKQERARALRAPWWQRAWMDLFLLIPVAYGVYLLNQQGSIVLPVAGGGVDTDPFQNPLLFLIPALGVFALTLFLLRILPLIMAGVAWIASHLSGVGVLLAVRHLSRSPGFYAAPLILLVLTLSLSAFTASIAETLDSHLVDETYYSTGADIVLTESGESPFATGGPTFGSGEEAPEEEEDPIEESGPYWFFLPVSEHLRTEGVEAAARVGRYSVNTRLSGSRQAGSVVGIDRVDFPKVAFWRRDFAPRSLGALLNAMAYKSNAVLVSRPFMAQHALRVGDTFRMNMSALGAAHEFDVEIVGSFDMFPDYYPDEGPLFVASLDYLFDQAGGQFPYDVWIKTDAPVSEYESMVDDMQANGLVILDWDAPQAQIAQEIKRPERQGLFGLLSVGFAAAAFLTVLGFLLYALFSFRRRFIELGILRAIGLSSGQMTTFLAWELAFLILVGIGAGTGLGAWISNLFIPYLQVGGDAAAQTPPFIVQIAWREIIQIYVLFGGLFVVALGGLAVLLLRMKIFQAVKLGETA